MLDQWTDSMRRVAEDDPAPEPQPDVHIHVRHGRLGSLSWQLVSAGQSLSGRRLLIVELPDDAAEERLLSALEALAGR
jgi:hypothetical protein